MNEFQVTSEELQKNLKTKFVYIASFFLEKNGICSVWRESGDDDSYV